VQKSEIDHGSSFTFSLNLLSGQQADEKPISKRLAKFDDFNILIIDNIKMRRCTFQI